MHLLLPKDRPDDYAIATGKTYSLERFIDYVFARLNLDCRIHVPVHEALVRPADITTHHADPRKPFRKLGWAPRYAMPDVAGMMVDAEMVKR